MNDLPYASWAEVYDFVCEQSFGDFYREFTVETLQVIAGRVHAGLATKPSGCVVCIVFDQNTLELGPFYLFSSAPKEPLKDLEGFAIGRRTKGKASGIKNLRPS